LVKATTRGEQPPALLVAKSTLSCADKDRQDNRDKVRYMARERDIGSVKIVKVQDNRKIGL